MQSRNLVTLKRIFFSFYFKYFYRIFNGAMSNTEVICCRRFLHRIRRQATYERLFSLDSKFIIVNDASGGDRGLF
jgi:hypothetical protein